MSKEVERRIARELARAEAAGSCLCPTSRADRAALERRLGHVRDNPERRIISPMPGLYVRWAYWRLLKQPARCLHLMRGLAALHPDWVFCGPSAAMVHGLSVSWSELRRVHVICGPRDGRRLSGRIVRHQIEGEEPQVVAGLRVTSALRAAFDCMSVMDFPDALAIADSVLRLSGMRNTTLMSLMRRDFRGRRGIARVLATCCWADPRPENGGESVARAIMIERGVALPALQVELVDPLDERRRFRVDFSWLGKDGRPSVGELDGLIKYTGELFSDAMTLDDVLRGERRREARVTAYDVRVARFSLDEIRNDESFWKIIELYRIPYGPAPEKVHGIPVFRAHIEGWRPGLGEDDFVTPEGMHVRYRVVAA